MRRGITRNADALAYAFIYCGLASLVVGGMVLLVDYDPDGFSVVLFGTVAAFGAYRRGQHDA
jgi:hypothetical protein